MLKRGIDFLRTSKPTKKSAPAVKCSKVKLAKRAKKKFDEKMLVKPKEPKRPFIFFLLEYLYQVKLKEPDMKHKDAFRTLGAIWSKNMTEEQKKPFHDLCEQDKIRCQKEKEEYEAKGYFVITKNGQNS